MSSWRDQVLKEFTPKVARLTLVADPDGLLLEEGILAGIRDRGFELIPFEDHVAFRYAYESKFRSRWDRGEQTDLVVVLRSQACDLGSLPYDLLQAGRKLSFNLGDIFPNLSYPVLIVLDRGDLDALYEAQKKHVPGALGDNATKEFVLRHIFEIAPEFIKEPADLLRVLLRRHYRGQCLPGILDQRFIQLLRLNNTFADWPLEIIVPDREVFLVFLQERWPVFLDHLAAAGAPSVKEQKFYKLTIDGPSSLPFDHHDIRVYLDNLFLEGLLQPSSHDRGDTLSKTWVRFGVRTDPAADRLRRLTKLIDSIRSSVPAEEAKYSEWLHFARSWAELALLGNVQVNADQEEIIQSIKDLQTQVDAAFALWLARRYAGLINLPPVPPVMLHHLPRLLARQMDDNGGCKVALLVVDGLSLEQWLVMREELVPQRPHLIFRENVVFAWVPTITQVSRQAIFAGKPPFYFPKSIQTTDKEPALWMQFWVDHGLSQNQVVYARGLGDGSLDSVEELLSHPQARVAGLVIDKVDKIMHGMELGAAGMHNQIRQWAQQPYLANLLDLLLAKGFCIFLTSDHGNIEATGCGRPSEGAVADLRGERVRVYSDTLLRNKVQDQFPNAIQWPSNGLPEDYLPLIAPGRLAFVREGEQTVSHGGIAIEELIVPLVQIARRDS